MTIYIAMIDSSRTMTQDDTTSEGSTGVSSAGRWCAIASELPCAIISLMLVGQVVGSAIGGPQGAMSGALLGVFVGFIFGVYSVYVTIQHFETIEQAEKVRHTYMPPIEEILEEPEFLRDYDSED